MGTLPRALYRLSQLRASLLARLQPADLEWVEEALAGPERQLFFRMPLYDQTHSVLVAREVERDDGDALLLRAALLHDCGKTLRAHRVPLVYRGGVVLLGAASPRLLCSLARRWGPLWPVYLHVHHPEIGARELERVGSPRAVVEMVRRHQEPSTSPEMRRLQNADARH